jgi:RHS repeat-associated protein
MIWRVFLFWLLGTSLGFADFPRHSSVALRENLPNSGTQTYAYDAEWRMTGITSPAGAFDYSYPTPNPASPLISGLALPNSATIANAYDPLGRLNSTALLNYWGHPLDGYIYGLDAFGLRTNILRELGVTTNGVAVGYNAMGEVTNWSGREYSGTGVVRHNEQLAYTYDAAGNLHIRTNDTLVQTFNVDSLNQLSNVIPTGPLILTGATPVPAIVSMYGGVSDAQTYGDFTFAFSGVAVYGTNIINAYALSGGAPVTATFTMNTATVTFQNDANGNLINDGTRVFSYDAENQLTNVFVTNTWRIGFVYDGLNRRRITREYTWQSTNWVETNELRYICDGPLVLQERDINNNPQVTYTRGLDLSLSLQGAGGIGGLLARTDSNGPTYYHADGSGNVTALMDGNENIVARYEYTGFGKMIGKWGALADANHYRFSSMEYFSNPGLYGYPRRFYEPNFQRWLNRDPVGENGGFNLYRFVHNRPTVEVDPLGFGANTITDGSSSYSSSGSMFAAPDGFAQAGPLYNPGPYPAFHSPLDMLPAGPQLSDAQALANLIGQGDDPAVVNGIFKVLNLIAMAGAPELGPAEEGTAAANAAKATAKCERTAAENAKARNIYKNNKDVARQAWENKTGLKWPTDANGNPWPGEHTPPLKDGGDPMTVTPRDPGTLDPHNIPGPDGLTDYQRWGALGTPARQANQ